MSGFSVDTNFSESPEKKPPVSASGERVIKPLTSRRRGVAPLAAPRPPLEPIFVEEPILALIPLDAQIHNLKFQLKHKEQQLEAKNAALQELLAENKELGLDGTMEEKGRAFALTGDLNFTNSNTKMSDQSNEIAKLQERVDELSKTLSAANTQNDTLNKDYEDLETKFQAEEQAHKLTKSKLNTQVQNHQKTEATLAGVRKELEDEQAENSESKTRIDELERIESNRDEQIEQLNGTISTHQAAIRTANQKVNDQIANNTGINALLNASQTAIDDLTRQLEDAGDREQALVDELERLKQLEHIDANVRETLGSFLENPSARFPLNPNAFQPHLRSPTKNRVVSAARSLADELENVGDDELISEDGSTSYSGSDGDARFRRGSNASDRPASPQHSFPKFIVRFLENFPTTVSTITLTLSEIVAAATLDLPLEFLDSGFVTFSDHELTPLPPVVITSTPQPQILSLTVPGTSQEIVPSPVPSPVTPAPVNLTYSGYAMQEVAPVSPKLSIQIDQGHQTIPPSPVNLSFSGITSQGVSPISIDYNLTQSAIRTVASLRPAPAVVYGHAGTQTASIPVVLTETSIHEVFSQSPTPDIVHDHAGTQTAEDPTRVQPVLTQTGILEVVSQAPAPVIAHDHVGTQTAKDPTPVQPVLTQTGIHELISQAPTLIAHDHAGTQTPSIVHGNSGTQTAQDPTPVPDVLTESHIMTINDEAPIVLVLPDSPHIEIIYVRLPYETSSHDPFTCWMTVEKNSWELICMFSTWLWTIFTISGFPKDATLVATAPSTANQPAQAPDAAQTAQPTASNDQAGFTTPHPAIPVQNTPVYRFKRRVLTGFLAQAVHGFVYLLVYWGLTIITQRGIWLHANESTRSFLSDILAYRANPDEHVNFWNPAFWIGEEMVLSSLQSVLFLTQNSELLQLKANYIPG